MILMVPQDESLWPTLGPQVCDFIEQNLVFGPGDLRGQPAVLDDEKRALIFRMYEVFPQGHPHAGRRRFKRCAVSLPKGTAKALALDTPLPTPTGWTTMGDVQAGDFLFGSDGRPCRVLAVQPVIVGSDCYRVGFSDGTSIVADGDHQWLTLVHAKMGGRSGVRTTREIRDTLYWHRSKPYARHRVPVAGPLELPETPLPVDPYILGSWLGDGRSDDASFTVASADWPNLREHVLAAGYFHGEPTPDTRRPETLAVRVSISPIGAANNNGRQTLKGALRDLGLLDNKHVPAAYLRAAAPQRLALLQGLLDTDGTALREQNACAFASTEFKLATGVLELCRSLGLRPTLQRKRAMLRGVDHGECYLVWFTPRDDVPAFRLARKLERSKRTAVKTSQALCRTIRSVDHVESVPVRCIAVDSPDHLYLAGEAMIPTHNTELAAWIAACELHPEGPVRCTGWTKGGEPIGGPVTDPYIPMVAYTEEQSDELAYTALKVVLEEGPLRHDFDIGLDRILRLKGDGIAQSLAGSPNARDGARTTFAHYDETHRWVLPRLKDAFKVMQANLPKRKMADAWSLETTTAFEPGLGSVAEGTMEYAQAVTAGSVTDVSLFFFHRYASDDHDMQTADGFEAAVIEASGPSASWRDIPAIVSLWKDPTSDRAYLERVYCNRLVRGSSQAFDVGLWKALRKDATIADGAAIALGFDGAMFHDSTGLVATDIATGYQWVVGAWERPPNVAEWQVPTAEVDALVEATFQRFSVQRMYADPPYWQAWIAKWAGTEWGKDRVLEWWTNRPKPMTYALNAFDTAIREGRISHDGDARFARHIGNARRKDLPGWRDEQGKPLWLIQKERPDSPHKIDLAMAATLSWEARMDAISAGVEVSAEPVLFFVGPGATR